MHGYRDIFSKKTKIVATLGPASDSPEAVKALAEAGANVFRLNLSHGTQEEHLARIQTIRAVAKELDLPLAVLLDLAGPKIRLGDFVDGTAKLIEGNEIELTTEPCEGTPARVHVTYAKFAEEVPVGSHVLINDGKLVLTVISSDAKSLRCRIDVGGEISGRRGVNVPSAHLSLKAITDKDRGDVEFALTHGVDFVALSFAHRASDVHELREILKGSSIGIITKVETKAAVENFESILDASDGIMVARGDLSVEIPLEEVPVIQKRLIARCNEAGKPVITATQMLGSMVSSPTPTRAEINDVANAIFDGTDAVMLSEETAMGNYPDKAVAMMARVATHTERYLPYEELLHHHPPRTVTGTVGFSAVNSAHYLSAKAIIALTASGTTPRLIARYRPARPIIVITDNEKTHNKLALSFNCYPLLFSKFADVFAVIEDAKRLLRERKVVESGDTVVFAAGVPLAEAGNTNTVMMQKI